MKSDQPSSFERSAASKRIFQFLTKNPAEDKAKVFFSKVRQFNPKPLTTIPEDAAVAPENIEKISDSPMHIDNLSTTPQASPFNSSFSRSSRFSAGLSSPTISLMVRSGSLSPRGILSARKSEESNFKSRYHLPMTGSQALLLYPENLSVAEQKEIPKYEQIYFFGELKVKKLTENFTDSQGVYRVVYGDHLCFRYEILELLGKGTFGHVYKCFDHKREIIVAVKILRKMPKIRKQGENEIKVLELVNDKDQDDSKNLVRMLQCFEFRGHLCISFELLSTNLFQFLRKNNFKGLNLNLIKRIALQILVALKYLHELGFTHSDLKLENILLKSEGKSSIKVIDMGSTITYVNPLCSYLQSRYYRAPEVILGAGYDNKIDIWSFGCILVELFTGRPLFPGENEHDQLIKIMSVLGVPPLNVLEKSRRRTLFFNDDMTPKIVKNKRGSLLYPDSKDLFNTSDTEELAFKNFVKQCLNLDKSLRITAEEALKHPWIRGNNFKDTGRNFVRRLRLNSFNPN